MRKIVLACVLLFCLLSCKKKDEFPKNILPREKMQAVLWDIIRTGEFVNLYILPKDTTHNSRLVDQKWYDKVYSLHKVSEADFKRSYLYYRQHPTLMLQVLDSIAKQKADPPKPNHPVATDSVIGPKKLPPIITAKNKALSDSLRRMRARKKKQLISPLPQK